MAGGLANHFAKKILGKIPYVKTATGVYASAKAFDRAWNRRQCQEQLITDNNLRNRLDNAIGFGKRSRHGVDHAYYHIHNVDGALRCAMANNPCTIFLIEMDKSERVYPRYFLVFSRSPELPNEGSGSFTVRSRMRSNPDGTFSSQQFESFAASYSHAAYRRSSDIHGADFGAGPRVAE